MRQLAQLLDPSSLFTRWSEVRPALLTTEATALGILLLILGAISCATSEPSTWPAVPATPAAESCVTTSLSLSTTSCACAASIIRRKVHSDRASIKSVLTSVQHGRFGDCLRLGVVHVGSRLFGFGLCCEADKAKAATAIRIPVLDDYLYRVSCRSVRRCGWVQTYRFFDLAILLKPFSQGLIAGVPGQASTKTSVS